MCRLVSISLLILCVATTLHSQTTASGALGGVVVDPSHAVIGDALVEITDSAEGRIQSTRTNRDGSYRFSFLAPGRYSVVVTHAGFRAEKRVVNVLLGPSVSANFTLSIAQITESMNVNDEVPLLHAENGDVSATMNESQVSEVPNPGNDLTYIVQSSPGAVMNTESALSDNFSILGMPGTSYRYTTDGLSDTFNAYSVPLNNAFGLVPGQNQVQEATVVSNGYSAQFGGAAGGNVNYVTKSGSNQFHGTMLYYWNGRALNANDWFGNAFGLARPFDNANQWAASLGGPVRKNKIFFFIDNEGMQLFASVPLFVLSPSPAFKAATLTNIDSKFGRDSASATFYRTVFELYQDAPGANSAMQGVPGDPSGGCGAFPTDVLGDGIPCAQYYFIALGRPSHDALTSGRVDWNIGRSDRVFFRVQYEHGISAIYSDPINSAFDADWNVPWWHGQVLETHTFGSTAASQFLFGRTFYSSLIGLKDANRALKIFPTTLNFNPLFLFNNLGGQPFWDLGLSIDYPQYQVSEGVEKTWSNHKLGFGASFEGMHWDLSAYQLNAVGTLTVQTLDAFYQGGFDPASSSVDFTQLTQSFARAKTQRLGFYNLAFYGQDEWHARPNLSFTFSLRAEHQSNPTCERSCFVRFPGAFNLINHDPSQAYKKAILTGQRQALAETDTINWSPRFSFAWQPFGASHSTVLRGGAGIFFDPVPGYLAQLISTNPPSYNSYSISGYSLTPAENNSLFQAAKTSNNEFVNGFNANETLSDITRADPNFAPPAITVPGARTRTPQFQKWSLELQRAFGSSTSFNVGYFGHHGIHELVLDPNVNAYGFGSLPPALCSVPPVPPCADPRFSGVTEIRSTAVSNYNGAVVSFQHRMHRWGQGWLQVNYTYGHALDEVSNGGTYNFTFGSSLSPQDPNNLRGAYGPAEYDVRHSLNASYLWEIPLKAALGGHGYDFVVKGWVVSETFFARTGFPYTVFDGALSGQLAANNYFGQIYAVPAGPLVSDPPCGKGAALPLSPHPCQIPQVLPPDNAPNPAARFVQAGCETGFNTGNLPGKNGPCDGQPVSFVQSRNRFRGTGYFHSDFNIMKHTKIPGKENLELGLGLQFFNVFNHPNFGIPDHSTSLASFGMLGYTNQSPTSLLGSGLGGDNAGRMIQVKAQLQF